MLDDRIAKLHEYIQIKQRTPAFRWYREIEVCNLVDYGNYYRRGKAYRDKLLPVVRQVNPNYLIQIKKVAEIIGTASQRYTAKKSGEIVAWILRKIVKLFHLEKMVNLEHTLAFVDTFPITDKITAPVFSFIPDDYERQNVLVKGVRHANYFLTLVQEMYGFHMPTTRFTSSITIPVMHTQIRDRRVSISLRSQQPSSIEFMIWFSAICYKQMVFRKQKHVERKKIIGTSFSAMLFSLSLRMNTDISLMETAIVKG